MRVVTLQTFVFAISKACIWPFRICVQPITRPIGTYTFSLIRMDAPSWSQTSGEYFFTREAAFAAGQSVIEDTLKTRNVRTRLGLSADISLAAQSSQSNFAARDKRKPAKEVRFNHRRPAPFCVAGGWAGCSVLTAARLSLLARALSRPASCATRRARPTARAA